MRVSDKATYGVAQTPRHLTPVPTWHTFGILCRRAKPHNFDPSFLDMARLVGASGAVLGHRCRQGRSPNLEGLAGHGQTKKSTFDPPLLLVPPIHLGLLLPKSFSLCFATHTSQWLFGDWGCVRRGAGVPGLASRAAAGRPGPAPRPPPPEAASGPARGPPPAAP